MIAALARRPLQAGATLLQGAFVAVFAGFIIGPLVVLALWSVAQQWFWPSLLPTSFTLRWFAWAVTVPNVFRLSLIHI